MRFISTGRQWTSETGRHVLIELQDSSRMEIVLTSNLAWRLLWFWPARIMV